VICEILNRMKPLSDGKIFEASNVTVLKYAGEGLWSSEEDVYNPAHFLEMIQAWSEHKQKLDQ
jgi:hypothetical protein